MHIAVARKNRHKGNISMNIWKHSDDRPRPGGDPLDTFRQAISKATTEAVKSGVLALHIHRALDAVARDYEHRAALRNMALGGR